MLVSLSRRLLHDLQVFFHVGRTLTRWQLGLGSTMTWEVQIALIESFALHARELNDFFYVPKRGREPLNAYAFDYFAGEKRTWHGALVPAQGPWLSRIKVAAKDPAARVDRFGKEIAHLTFEEAIPLTEHAHGWPVMQIANELGTVLRVFVQNVSGVKIDANFKTKALREIPLPARLERVEMGALMWARPIATRPTSRVLPRG